MNNADYSPDKPQNFYNLINGEAVAAASGEWLESVDPAKAEVWAHIPAGDAEDIDRAVQAAESAFRGEWSAMPALRRAGLLRNLAALVQDNLEPLARLEARDNGRVLNETLVGDLPAIVEMYYYWAGVADKLHGETVTISPASFNYVRHEPVGVVGIVIPWNAPLALFTAKVAAALAAGNTVVVKPAEQACCSVLAIASLFEHAGFPPGVVNVVAGLGATAGDALVAHPKVRKISFTGSTATARVITRRSADVIKPLSFELGGKSANIVFADADLDQASVGASTMSVFTGGAGQACIAGSRILAHRSIYHELIERITGIVKQIKLGDPMDRATTMGPIAFQAQHEKVKQYIELGREEGGEIIFGGRSGAELFEAGSEWGSGYFVEPTLFAGLENSTRTCREEIFGPVACIMPFDEDDEALAIANDSSYGLAAGVWTKDLKRAHKMAAALETGAVWVNNYRKIHWTVPFGGTKDSGYGRDSGLESLKGYMQTKGVWIDLA